MFVKKFGLLSCFLETCLFLTSARDLRNHDVNSGSSIGEDLIRTSGLEAHEFSGGSTSAHKSLDEGAYSGNQKRETNKLLQKTEIEGESESGSPLEERFDKKEGYSGNDASLNLKEQTDEGKIDLQHDDGASESSTTNLRNPDESIHLTEKISDTKSTDREETISGEEIGGERVKENINEGKTTSTQKNGAVQSIDSSGLKVIEASRVTNHEIRVTISNQIDDEVSGESGEENQVHYDGKIDPENGSWMNKLASSGSSLDKDVKIENGSAEEENKVEREEVYAESGNRMESDMVDGSKESINVMANKLLRSESYENKLDADKSLEKENTENTIGIADKTFADGFTKDTESSQSSGIISSQLGDDELSGSVLGENEKNEPFSGEPDKEETDNSDKLLTSDKTSEESLVDDENISSKDGNVEDDVSGDVHFQNGKFETAEDEVQNEEIKERRKVIQMSNKFREKTTELKNDASSGSSSDESASMESTENTSGLLDKTSPGRTSGEKENRENKNSENNGEMSESLNGDESNEIGDTKEKEIDEIYDRISEDTVASNSGSSQNSEAISGQLGEDEFSGSASAEDEKHRETSSAGSVLEDTNVPDKFLKLSSESSEESLENGESSESGSGDTEKKETDSIEDNNEIEELSTATNEISEGSLEDDENIISSEENEDDESGEDVHFQNGRFETSEDEVPNDEMQNDGMMNDEKDGRKVIQMSRGVLERSLLGNWTVFKAMDKLLSDLPKKTTTASRVCRPGPLMQTGSVMTTGKRNCLLVGDSISIGYLRVVQSYLRNVCMVYHAPWSGDGGSLDTKYLLQCLPMMLSTSILDPTSYDAIIFNSGLHDIDLGFHEEYCAECEYKKNIKELKDKLLATGAAVAFADTTPVPYNVTLNNRVKQYNKAAREALNSSVEIIDLYTLVTKLCTGEPPYKKCRFFRKQPNVHFNLEGYQRLGLPVAKMFYKLLTTKPLPKVYYKPSPFNYKHLNPRIHKDVVYCQTKNGLDLTGCPINTTCSYNMFSGTHVGCCLLPDAVDCGNNWHCCPKGTICDPKCSPRKCSCLQPPWNNSTVRHDFDKLMKTLNNLWMQVKKEYPIPITKKDKKKTKKDD